ELRQRRTGVGWATLRDAPGPADLPSLTVREVDGVFATVSELSGAGSAGERRRLIHDLFDRASADEQWFLRGLVSGELRQGALEGVMLDAVAVAAEVPPAAVRRAAMLCGAVAPVAEAADGRPRPFQETGARAATRAGAAPLPLSLFVFDALHVDGSDLLDLPLRDRLAAMSSVVPEPQQAARLVTSDAARAQSFFDAVVAAGHEGVVVKALEAAYDAGRRGSAWLK